MHLQGCYGYWFDRCQRWTSDQNYNCPAVEFINKMVFSITMPANLITMIESVIYLVHFGLWPNFYRRTSIEWLFVKVTLWKLISNALYENFSINVSDGNNNNNNEKHRQQLQQMGCLNNLNIGKMDISFSYNLLTESYCVTKASMAICVAWKSTLSLI